MRIIAVGTLRRFWNRPGRGDAEQPLRAWVHVVRSADWSKPTEVKAMFGNADILKNGRGIFDIGGNKYRLVAAIPYRGQPAYVRLLRAHQEDDKIAAQIGSAWAALASGPSRPEPTTRAPRTR